MKINKKAVLGAAAISALSLTALVSCGSKGPTTYNFMLDGNASNASNVSEEVFNVTDAKTLIDAIKDVKPTRTGYVFSGWYLDAACSIPLSESANLADVELVEGYRTVYAKWEISRYTVTFDTRGNAAVAGVLESTSVGANYNTTIAQPTFTVAAKTTNGAEMSLAGWYTDAELTQAFDFNTKVTGDITLYPKWEIASIATAEEFVAYVNSNSTMNAELTADIDMTDVSLSRKLDDLTAEQMNSAQDAFSVKLNHIFDGCGHTISNLDFGTDIKRGGIWATVAGTVKNVTFADSTYATSKGATAFIAGQVQEEALFEDVTLDGVVINSTDTSNGQTAFLVNNVKNANVVMNGVVLTDCTIDATKIKYSGGLIAQAEGISNVEINDCMIDCDIINGDQGVSPVIGQIKKDSTVSLAVDGLVVSSNVTGSGALKNVGAVVGDLNATAGTVSVKNVVVLEMNISDDKTTSTTLNPIFGQLKVTPTYDNVSYRKYGVDMVNKEGRLFPDDEGQGVAVKNTALASLSTNIVLGETGYTLNNVTLEYAADPEEVDLSTAVPTVAVEGATASELTDGKISVTGTVQYVQGVIAGAAGNAVKVTITPDASITNKEGRYVSGLENVNIDDNGVITGYIYYTAEQIAETKAALDTVISDEIYIEWFYTESQVALPTVITVETSVDVVLAENEAVATAISLSADDTNGLTAAADATTLNVTAGNVLWNTDASANIVTVEVAKPTWAGELAVSAKGAATSAVMNTEGTAVVVTVKVGMGNNKFNLIWDAAHDAIEYNVALGGTATVEANPNAAGATDWSYVPTAAADKTTGEVTAKEGCLVFMAGITIDANNKSYDADSKSWTLRMKTAGALNNDGTNGFKVTVLKACTIVTYSIASSGSATDRFVKVISASGDVKYTSTVCNGSAIVKDEITIDAAGTYYIGSSNSGINFYEIDVKY